MANKKTINTVTADHRPPSAVVGQPSFIKATLAIIHKDLAAEFRSRELLTAMLTFSVLVILIFNFALDLNIDVRQKVTAGVLWTTFAFAGTLGLNRSMAVEKDRGCMDGLLLAPVDRSAIFFGKAISNLAFMLIVEAIVLPLYAFFYNETRIFKLEFIAVLLLGSIGYISVGTILSAMSVQTRTRELLLPILLFPIVVPVLIASVLASGAIINDMSLPQIMTPLNLLIVYDIIFIAVSFMFFDFIVEE
ncbi:MAG: heme exporter protein CcmB [Anaerolineales bacterium]|nr:heme exporter protein CcmB [Anaerolineales bacterium]